MPVNVPPFNSQQPFVEEETRILTREAFALLSFLRDRTGGDNDIIAIASPVGSMVDYAGTAAPDGWLLCDGSAVSRITYSDLFAVTGVAFGAGDGATTFNLPDFRGRVPVGTGTGSGLSPRAIGDTGGEEAHALTVAELAIHGHSLTDTGHTHTVNDTGHNHTVNDTGHTHGITDTGHTHTVSDPGHSHGVTDGGHSHAEASGANFVNDAAGTEYVNTAGDKGTVSANTASATTGVTVNSATTGITNNSATTGITNNSATTGITNNSNTTGITNNSATTGITVDNTGSGDAHNTMQPFVVVTKIIRY